MALALSSGEEFALQTGVAYQDKFTFTDIETQVRPGKNSNYLPFWYLSERNAKLQHSHRTWRKSQPNAE
jgi:hypothetical protein